MASCTCENWTLEDLSNALQDMHKDSKRITVPMFQRGKRWNKGQQNKFIDSLLKGYPVGTMLFYETFDEGKQNYILVDGLQRGNSIKLYMNNPTEFFYDSNISDEFCQSILTVVNANLDENYSLVRSLLTTFIKQQKTFKNLQYYKPAKMLSDAFDAGIEPIGELIEVIGKFFTERQELYDQIASTVIPVIVYHGDASNLPEIFDRINSQGTPLDQYEVYAAAWPVNNRFAIENMEIVEAAIRKYDCFVNDGFIIQGYNREQMRMTKQVNAFEYLFGLSKYLVNKYDILGFNRSLPDDRVNSLGFELVNACLNDTNKIKNLFENIYSIDNITSFENALCQAIDYVSNSISVITRFKGNNRLKTKLFHSKYQILSMISTTFKEMFVNENYDSVSNEFNQIKANLSINLRAHYVYDIITNYWSEGGTSKIYSVAKPNKYRNKISPRAWGTALDAFFEKSMLRTESQKIANPQSEEYVILNCIYLNTFTAMDQLSMEKFDVEHIATKDQMKKLISKCGGKGLPVSCIANLCYLPEYVNRSKKEKNFYQDTKYLSYVNLEEVERKYSFTISDDLEWMEMPYEGTSDYGELHDFYFDFCKNRFSHMKKLFCDSMRIDYEEMIRPDEEEIVLDSNNSNVISRQQVFSVESAQYERCVDKIETHYDVELIKKRRCAFSTSNNDKGFIFGLSKSYKQGNRKKYWFAFREKPFDDLGNCEVKYMVYGFKDNEDLLCIPYEKIKELSSQMNYSLEDEEISHWHVVFLRDDLGSIKLLLSKPDMHELDVNQYKV